MITINGIQYEQRDLGTPHPNGRMSRVMLASLMVAAASLSGVSNSPGKSPMPVVDLEMEFAFIQAKKSKLSKRERDWVEQQFHRRYKVVDQPINLQFNAPYSTELEEGHNNNSDD